jgi:hypothetical protein
MNQIEHIQEKDNTDDEDNRSPKEIVLDAVDNQENSTMENVVKLSVEDGLDEDKARRIIERTLQKGYAIQNNGIIKLI